MSVIKAKDEKQKAGNGTAREDARPAEANGSSPESSAGDAANVAQASRPAGSRDFPAPCSSVQPAIETPPEPTTTIATYTPESQREPAANLDCGGKHSDANHRPSPRQRLVQILESYGVPLHGFDALRSDAYERHLAGRSLKELDLFYGRLLNPSEPYEIIRKQCRRWGKGSKHKGKLPSVKTLTNIRERIRLDGMLERVACTPEVKNAATINAVQAYVLADLMGVVEEGKRMIDHLPVVDRVIRTVNSRTRMEQGDKRAEIAVKLAEVKVKEQELEREKYEWVRGGKRIVESPQEQVEDTWDVEAEKAKVRAMSERIYGKNPFEGDNEPASVTLDPNGKNNKDALENPNSSLPTPENIQKPKADALSPNAAPEMTPPVLPGQCNPASLPAETETLPDMQYVRYGAVPSGKFPDGLGVCSLTGRWVDLRTKRYAHVPRESNARRFL